MPEASIAAHSSLRGRASALPCSVWLGVLLGFVMPTLSALLYPTYRQWMPDAWVEWTRINELPFIVCEMVVVHIALRRGMRDRDFWLRMPKDVRIASALLLLGITVSTVFVSKNLGTSLAISLFTIVHVRFALAVFFLARSERLNGIEKLLPLLGCGLTVLAVLTAWKFALPPPPPEVIGGPVAWVGALPGFINVRHFGSWTGAIAAGLMTALLYPGDERPSRWLPALYFLAVGMTLWSGTRAALLALAVVALIMLVTLRRWPSFKAMGLVAALTVVAFAVALPLLPPGEPDFRLFNFGDLNTAESATGGRLALWHAAYAKWLEAPLFGWGSGSTFWEVYAPELAWHHTQPHNVILQFLVSWGIVGAAGGLWLIARAIAAAHVEGVRVSALRPLTGMLYSLLFMSLLEGMLHYPRFIMMIMLGLAVILAHKNMRANALA